MDTQDQSGRARGGGAVETVRFYERLASGYRDYPPESVERVRCIRRTQRLGFTLAEIRELLALHPESRRACAEARARAAAKLTLLRNPPRKEISP